MVSATAIRQCHRWPSTTDNKAKHPHVEKRSNKQVPNMAFARARDPPPLWVQYCTVSACSVFRLKTKNHGFNFVMHTHMVSDWQAIAKGTVNSKKKTHARSAVVFFCFCLCFFPPRSPSLLLPAFTCSGARPEPRSNRGMEAVRETHSSTVASCIVSYVRESEPKGQPTSRARL